MPTSAFESPPNLSTPEGREALLRAALSVCWEMLHDPAAPNSAKLEACSVLANVESLWHEAAAP